VAIKEKVIQEDLYLYEILRNPVLCTEFIQNTDKLAQEEPFELSWYQKEMLCDFHPNSVLCSGRAIGKTVSLVAYITWLLIYNVFPEDYIVYTVPSKVHLEPVFAGLIRTFRSNSFLKNFLDGRGGINSSDFTVKLLNNSLLMCRIAGQSGTGANVIGLHTPVIVLDEAGYYPYGTWTELQPTWNTWTPGCTIKVSGVPTGIREKNVLYHCDMENTNYTKHRISALQNPRFTEDDLNRAIEQYGGTDSEDYTHLVLGQHGKPVFSLFDRSNFDVSNYPVFKLKIDGTDLKENLYDYYSRIATFPGVTDKGLDIMFGIDLGYTEPTAIIIYTIDKHARMRFHARLQLTKVPYPIQERIIDELDRRFEPILIGMDKGGVGLAVFQNLMDSKDYAHKNFKKKLIGIDFSSNISLGVNAEGEEIKYQTKQLSVSVSQDYSNTQKIIYSSTDLDFITELERMTYTKTPTGQIVYKTLTLRGGSKGEDHFTSAFLCANMAYYLHYDYKFKEERKKLTSFSWL
jgi:hypothetical protein